jgi:hypothetical protein
MASREPNLRRYCLEPVHGETSKRLMPLSMACRTAARPCSSPAPRCAAWSASRECLTASGCCRSTSCRRSCRGGRRWTFFRLSPVSLESGRARQVPETECIGQAPVLAEVRQSNDDSVDLACVRLEQRSALLCVLMGFDGAMRGSSGVSTMALIPAASRAAIISSRPFVARWPGKNPRLPTTTPNVICLPIECDVSI